MKRGRLAELASTNWAGTGELWLDKLQNEAHRYECTLAMSDKEIRYTWSHDGKAHNGIITLGETGATWTDSWHQPKPVECTNVPGTWALFAVQYAYAAGEGPDWGWRIALAERSSSELVLQMTNIYPWGEEGRAVRMNLSRQS